MKGLRAYKTDIEIEEVGINCGIVKSHYMSHLPLFQMTYQTLDIMVRLLTSRNDAAKSFILLDPARFSALSRRLVEYEYLYES